MFRRQGMSDSDLSCFLREQWREIAGLLWPESPQEPIRAELDRLDAQLERQQAQLLRCRQKIEKIDDRLGLVIRSSAHLSAESRRSRRRIAGLHERLQAYHRRYARLLARLDCCKQQRERLRKELLSASRTPEEDKSTSDCLY
jgi:uncharacterized coiled-coil DUF342 family protein